MTVVAEYTSELDSKKALAIVAESKINAHESTYHLQTHVHRLVFRCPEGESALVALVKGEPAVDLSAQAVKDRIAGLGLELSRLEIVG